MSQCGSAACKEMGYPGGEELGLVVAQTSQHEGNLMKLAGCPLEEVQRALLQYSLQSFFKHHRYTTGNDCMQSFKKRCILATRYM